MGNEKQGQEPLTVGSGLIRGLGRMSLADHVEAAKEWGRGITVHADSQGWRVTGIVLAEAVERLTVERDRYRGALNEMSKELSHYPEGNGIFGHLKHILRRALTA